MENARRVTGTLLALLSVLTGIVLLAANPHVFVALSSDKEGRPLFPAATLAPGSAITGDLTLANEGLLPLRYQLQVRSATEQPPGAVVLRIRRDGDSRYLYQGPLTADAIPIGSLLPGQRDHLQLTLAAPPNAASSSLAIDDTFVWTGRSGGIDSWLWLLVVAAALIVAAFALPRVLDAAARVLRRARPRRELYWRVPLILAVILVAILIPLSSVSLANANVRTSNPANTFAVGSLVLANGGPSRTSCLSVSTLQAQTATTGRCDAIFAFSNGAPGDTRSGRLNLRNVGTAPIGSLTVWSSGCQSQPVPDARFYGTADACAGVDLTIHDDTHAACVFPVAQRGACPTAGTMRSFARSHPAAAPLALDAAGLGGGLDYTFTVTIDAAAGNSDQGLAPTMDFTWAAAQ